MFTDQWSVYEVMEMTRQKTIVAALIVLLAGVTIWRIFFATEEATVDETSLAVTVQQVSAEEVQLPVTFTVSV